MILSITSAIRGMNISVCSPLLDSVQHDSPFAPSYVGVVWHSSGFTTTVYGVASVYWGIFLDIVLYFIVETLNYATIMSRIN